MGVIASPRRGRRDPERQRKTGLRRRDDVPPRNDLGINGSSLLALNAL